MSVTESVCEREREMERMERERESARVRERERERARGREGERERERERGQDNPQFALIGLSSGGDSAVCSRRIEQLTAF